jgi:hypothetical protein
MAVRTSALIPPFSLLGHKASPHAKATDIIYNTVKLKGTHTCAPRPYAPLGPLVGKVHMNTPDAAGNVGTGQPELGHAASGSEAATELGLQVSDGLGPLAPILNESLNVVPVSRDPLSHSFFITLSPPRKRPQSTL